MGKLAKQLLQQTKDVETRKLEAEANKELAESLGLLTKAMEEALKVKKLQTDLDKEQLKLLQSEEDLRRAQLDISKDIRELDQKLNDDKKKGLGIDKDKEKRLKELRKEMLRYTQGVKEWRKALVAKIKADEKEIKLEEDTLDIIQEKDRTLKTLTTKYIDLGKANALWNNAAARGAFISTQLLKLSMKMIDSTIAVTKLYDEQRGALSAVATQGMNYSKSMSVVMNASTGAGLSFKEASEGLIELGRNFNDVALLTTAQTKNLALLTAGMKKFGIDISGTLNSATLAMGMTANDAGDLALQLFAVGDALGPRMRASINKDFGPAMSTLAAYTNDRAIAIFKKLAAQAQATGLQISDLLGIAAQFDTYDSAAESVGRLNSMLGGDYLNSVQMLKATEEERMVLLRRSLVMSGRSWSALDRFQKKAIAAAVGITDMAKAFQVFGTEQEKLDALSDKAEKAGMTLEQFQARMKAVNTVMQRFKVIGQALATVFGPVIDIIHLFVRGLEWIVTNVLGETGVKVVLLSVLAILSYFAIKAGMVASAIWLVAAAVTTLIGLFVNLDDTLTKPHSPILFIMLGVILPAAFALLAGMAHLAAGAIKAFGEAASIMGVGLQVLGVGLVSLQSAIASMGFLGFTGLLFDIGRLSLAGSSMGAAAGGIMIFATAIQALADAFMTLSTVKGESIRDTAKMFESISKIDPINAISMKSAMAAFAGTLVLIHTLGLGPEKKKEKHRFELNITHNNVQETNKAIATLGNKMADAFGKYRTGA